MDSIALNFLNRGQMLLFAQHTGYYFFLEGIVVRGKRYGSKINFPTANLLFVHSTILPKLGCYLTLVSVNATYYPGLTCLIANQENKAIIACETHLQNFTGDVYGEKIIIFFLRFFRDNISFPLWQQNCRQIIAQDLKQFQQPFLVKIKAITNYQKNAKIESNLIEFFHG